MSSSHTQRDHHPLQKIFAGCSDLLVNAHIEVPAHTCTQIQVITLQLFKRVAWMLLCQLPAWMHVLGQMCAHFMCACLSLTTHAHRTSPVLSCFCCECPTQEIMGSALRLLIWCTLFCNCLSKFVVLPLTSAQINSTNNNCCQGIGSRSSIKNW